MESGPLKGQVLWLNMLILHLLEPAFHMGTGSCPGSSIFNLTPYLWPTKAAEDGSGPWASETYMGDQEEGAGYWLQISLVPATQAIWGVNRR